MNTSNDSYEEPLLRPNVAIPIPNDAPRDSDGRPTSEAIEQASPVIRAIIERLFGKPFESIKSKEMLEYVANNARSKSDIASYHAHRVTQEFLISRKVRVGAVDRWLSEQKKEDALVNDEKALSRLVEAFESKVKEIVDYAWGKEKLLPQTMLEGCRIVDTNEQNDGTIEVRLEPSQIIQTNKVTPQEVDSMLRPDALLAEKLEVIGKNGRESAKIIREYSSKRWQQYTKHLAAGVPELLDDAKRFASSEPPAPFDKPFDNSTIWRLWLCLEDMHYPPWVRVTIKSLWLDVVRPQLSKAPALTRLVHTPVTHLLSAPKVRNEGGQIALEVGLSQPCIIREVADIPNAKQGLELFKSIHAHRVLWHIVFTAHDKAICNPGWSPHLEYHGGYAALAEACGISGRDGAVKVRDLIDLFSVLDLVFPGYRGGLLTRTFIEAKGQRRALLKIIPGTPLLPGYVHELRKTEGTISNIDRLNQNLIPLLPIPPVLGRANDAGSQATMQLNVVAHLRDHATELAKGKGAPLPPETWVQLANESCVPRSIALKLLSHWQEDHQDGPAVLKQIDINRYTLGDKHAAARIFLEEGGHRSLESSENGRSAVKRRDAARHKASKK